MSARQAIRTRYIGQTNTKPARISAQCEGGRVIVPYNDEKDLEANHRYAFWELRNKMEWFAPQHQEAGVGVFDRDYYWVFYS
ncbi:MAG TPA: hypothetical protein VKE92_01895 [Anaerolineales bacterium]|nr:hypothetical protein [Anaerolineales bacterium]